MSTCYISACFCGSGSRSFKSSKSKKSSKKLSRKGDKNDRDASESSKKKDKKKKKRTDKSDEPEIAGDTNTEQVTADSTVSEKLVDPDCASEISKVEDPSEEQLRIRALQTLKGGSNSKQD
jgi:hypothetical protein